MIKLIKEIEILSSRFNITYDKTSDAGGFSWNNATITIGIKSIKTDPTYTIGIISHEIMEVILCGMGARFNNSRTADNHLFNFDHQTFENAIQIHIMIMLKFLK